MVCRMNYCNLRLCSKQKMIPLLWIINVELIISFFTCMKSNKINHLKNTLVSPNGFLMVNFLHFVIQKIIFYHKFPSF